MIVQTLKKLTMDTLDNMSYYKIKIGKIYQVTAEPKPKPSRFPEVGSTGICKWVSSQDGACIHINGENYLLPFNCIEERTGNVEDAYLITLMVDNPKATLKLLRGLWRMTKHETVRNLMERGELPIEKNGNTDSTKVKSSGDYDKQWEECLAAGAFATEIFN